VLIVSGIWPPDVGGPASHAPDVAAFLAGRGHAVHVLTTAGERPAARPYPVEWVSRSLPAGVRHARVAERAARLARRVDVVYSTGMFVRTAAGARAALRPYVVKLTGDPAFERLRWRGTVDGDLDAFQATRGGVQARVLRRLRDAMLSGAAHVFTPSAYLRDLAVSWGVDAGRVELLPNPAPAVLPAAGRDELRQVHGLAGPTLVFAGRLTAAKALPVLLEALQALDGVRLVVAGDGPDRALVEQTTQDLALGDRVRFLGSQPRERVLELFLAADLAVLSSAWENHPHCVVEALAVGTPVVATDVGGVGELVQDGVNGLLVPPGRPHELAAALRRVVGDDALRARLAAAAAPSVAAYAPVVLLGRVEDVLRRACS
jgi:glycosyltransferase involved in cell wall biosynthesis